MRSDLLTSWKAVVVFCLLIVAPLFFGKFYAVGDMKDVFIPLETFFQSEQREWRIPAWQPNASWGFPAIASAQIGFFYPPLLLARFLPIPIEFSLILISHVLLNALGMYVFLQKLKLKKEAVFLGTIAYAGSSFFWQHIPHLNIIITSAWFPWQMLAAWWAAHANKLNIKHIAAYSLSIAIPFVAGQLHIPILMAGITSLFFLYTRWQNNRIFSKSLISLTAVCALAFLLAAVQLLPTAELFMHSSRSGENFDIVRANQHSFHPHQLPTVVFPRFFGSADSYWGGRLEVELGSYIGVFPLMLAISWLVMRKKKPEYRFFSWLMIIGFLLSLGYASPFRIIGFEPSLWVFTAPARWMMFAVFSASVLSARAIDAEIYKDKVFQKMTGIIAIIVVSIVAVVNIMLFLENFAASSSEAIIQYAPSSLITETPQYYEEKISRLVSYAQKYSISLLSPFTILPLIIFCIIPFIVRRKHGLAILFIVTTIDLIMIAGTATELTSWKEVMKAPETIRELPTEIQQNQARIYNIRSGGDTGGTFSDPHSRPNEFTRELQKNLLLPLISSQFNLAGIEWPASLDLAKQWQTRKDIAKPQQQDERINIELAQELNIGVVISPEAENSGDHTTLSENNIGVHIQQLNPSSRIEFITTNGTEAVHYHSPTPSSIVVKLESKDEGTLLIRDTYFPGWQAYVDEAPTPIREVEPFFRSIEVPSGSHTVRIEYQPKAIPIGMSISLGAFLLTTLALYTYRRI